MVYMDDIIIFSPNIESHVFTLNQVLERLVENKLKLKVEKSKFLQNQVHYLGYIISSEGLVADPKKTETIRKILPPDNVKKVQSFLGMCNYYRRYIPNYAGIAKPLYDLCKKDALFKWDEKCNEAFENFKRLLSNPPILIYPSFNQTFILTTDSSDYQIGSYLSQGEIPHDKPIQYFSKILNPAQTRYSTIEKELLAIILSVEYFRHYLTGREFIIVTDHRPLMFLFNAKDCNARLHRWKYTLMGFQFKIEHKKGKTNVVADALSRLTITDNEHKDLEKNPTLPLDLIEADEMPLRTRRFQDIEEIKRYRRRLDSEHDCEYNNCETNQNRSDSDDSSDISEQEYEFFDPKFDCFKNSNMFVLTRAQRQALQNPNEEVSSNSNIDMNKTNKKGKTKNKNVPLKNKSSRSGQNISEIPMPNTLTSATTSTDQSQSHNENCSQVESQSLRQESLLNENEYSTNEPYVVDDDSMENIPSNSSVSPTDKIIEQPNTVISSNKYNHIFFIFDKMNCELHKKLQHKLRVQFHFKFHENIYSVDSKRTILLMPLSVNKQHNELQMLTTIDKIYNMCEMNNYYTVAINVDFKDYQIYFEFKTILLEKIETTMIHATIFLNKVIEITDIEIIDKILKSHHDGILAGHPGLERMKCTIQKKYRWVGMNDDIKKFIKNCSVCELAKINKHTKNPMTITSTASEPFQKIYIDIVGPVNPISIHGNEYILTYNCSLTKFAIAVPIPNYLAITTAKALVHSVFLKYGLAEEVVSDNGKNFVAEILKEVLKLFKIKKTFTTIYRPQGNQVERYHKTLANYLKSFIQQEQERWCEYIDFATFAYNNTYNSATGFTPFELVFGRSSKLPTDITKRQVPIYNYENYSKELRLKLKQTHDLAKANLLKSKENNKYYYDKNRSIKILELKVNDLVLMLKGKKKFKFENPYEGPYRVEKIISPTVVVVRQKSKSVKINTERLKLATADYGDKVPPPI